jgi:transketolase
MTSPFEIAEFQRKARAIRATVVQMAHDGREGHLNGALSSVEILLALYYTWLNVDTANPKIPNRDRLIFSKGHACASLYAVMAERGFFPAAELRKYAQGDSPYPSHPCTHALPLLEWSAGSLGHGLGIGAGIAYALRLKRSKARVAVVCSDGECNEGTTWESATFAAAQNLENLLLVVDNNGVQSVGRANTLLGKNTSLEDKFRAFGWGARTVAGNDFPAVTKVLSSFPFEKGLPSVLIARTTAAAGVSFMEDQVLWHYRVPSPDDLAKALQELGENPLTLEEV